MTPNPRTVLSALMTAVARYLVAPTTGNRESMAEALRKAEAATTARRGW